MRASAAIPFLFPAVRIDDRYYVDGGLRMNTPLSPALRLGADQILGEAEARRGGPAPRAEAEISPARPASAGRLRATAPAPEERHGDALEEVPQARPQEGRSQGRRPDSHPQGREEGAEEGRGSEEAGRRLRPRAARPHDPSPP